MIAAIRKFAKSGVAVVLIGLLVISFAIFGINDVFKGGSSTYVATAGSRKISLADFKREFDNFRKGAEQQVGQPITAELAAENGLDTRVLNDVADREAFGEMLDKVWVRPSDTLMTTELQKNTAFFNPVSGRFDKALYESMLGQNGLTPARFETYLHDQIAEAHLASALANGLRVPRAYSALGAIYGLESRDIGYFMIDPRTVTPPALPTDAQLLELMKANAAQLTRPEFRILTVVRFSPGLVSANLPIDEAELQKRFEYRKDTLSRPETRSIIQIPVKDAAAAQSVGARLAKGEAPAAIAKSLGVDAITYVDKPRTAIADRKVGEAAFALKAGQIAPVRGDLGFSVVAVGKVTPGQAVTLAQIRPQLEAELRKDAAAEKVYQMSQAYDDAHTGGASLTEAAKKAGVPAMTLGPVSLQGGSPEGQRVAGVSEKLLKTAFDLPVSGESDIEDAGQGEYYAVRVERVIPKALPPLSEVRPQLTRVWMMREMVKRLQAKADELAGRVRKGESLEAVAGSIGARVAHAAGLDRQNAGQSKALSQDALVKTFNAKAGETFTAEATTFGLIVGKLEAIRPPSGSTLARITEDSRPQMTEGAFRELQTDARRAARALVKVKTYPNNARMAIGLEPLDPKAAKGAKTEPAT